MTGISIIVAFVLFLFLFISIRNKDCKQFTSIFILLLLLYDWIFICIGYALPSQIVLILKSFSEILIMLFLLLLLARTGRYVVVEKIDVLIAVFCGIPFITSILSGGGFSSLALSGYKDFFFVYIISYLLLKSRYLVVDYRVLDIITIIVSTGAILQTFFFNGNLETLWFYNSFDNLPENPVDVGYYNYLKDDALRATSCFVTPIDLSITSAMLIIYHVSQVFANKEKSAGQLMLAIYAFVGLWISQTRVGLVIVAIGICTLILLKIKKNKISLWILYLIPLSFIALTFLMMVVGKIDDYSALGRMVQYANFINDFSLMGGGIGDYDAIFKYDSFLLCSFKMMGIFAILYFILYFRLFNTVVSCLNNCGSKVLYLPFVVATSTAMMYAFVFQHLAGSIALILVTIFMFDVLRNYNK